jgi:hypothetical protein
MQKVHEIKELNNTLIIVISGGCGQCDDRTVEFAKSIDSSVAFKEYDKFIVFPDRYTNYADKIKGYGFVVLKDKDYLMRRYNVEFEQNAFLEINKKEKITYWQWINIESYFDLNQKYDIEAVY